MISSCLATGHWFDQMSLLEASAFFRTAASSLEKGFEKSGTKSEVAAKVGKTVAERALAAGINTVVFDRNGYLYHGRVKSLADAAREGGLKF